MNPGFLMMSKLMAMFFVLAIAITTVTSASSACETDPSISQPNPKIIYHRAWKLVRDNYYDPSHNGQNWATWEHRFDNEFHNSADAFRSIGVMLESLNDSYTRILIGQ